MDPHFEVERSKFKVTRPISAVTKNQSYLWNGKAHKCLTWYMDGIRWPTSLTCVVTSKLIAMNGRSTHHLQGVWAYFGSFFDNFCKCRPIFIIHSLLNWEMGCKRSWDKNVTPQNCCGINLQKITAQLYNFTFISARIICFTWHLFHEFLFAYLYDIAAIFLFLILH